MHCGSHPYLTTLEFIDLAVRCGFAALLWCMVGLCVAGIIAAFSKGE